MTKNILNDLPAHPTRVTRYWPPKFAVIVIVGSGITKEQAKEYFLPEKWENVKEFMRHIN